jgi:ABC-type polysaccharide/polyol phosphate export permease
MEKNKWTDDLTPFERTVYRWVSYLALAVVFYCVLMVRKYPESTVFFVIGLFALLIAMIFGGGYSKSVRVLDLRRFDKHAREHRSRRD